ncbi:MAG: prepilin-type N-terminal cleavage/methylation domain-containing protein [Candidatus Hydrogenedentes bacterium]|nr:prepilin-type N-terminal cleavage/methylation domain-containing protein [Candidatus Hydrogenedentota bacterium]
MNYSHKHKDGFTLAEVLVALVILGGGMFVLVNAHFSALSLHLYTQEEVDTRMLLEMAVAHAEMGIATEELSGGSDFGPRYPGYSYSYDAQPMGDTENPYMMDIEFYTATATLTTPDGETTSLEFHTFLNPEMSTTVQTQQ